MDWTAKSARNFVFCVIGAVGAAVAPYIQDGSVDAKYVQDHGIVLCVSFDVGQWMTNMCISVGVVEDIVFVQFVSIFGKCFHSFQAIFVFVTVVTREHKLPVVAVTSRNQENDVHPHR